MDYNLFIILFQPSSVYFSSHKMTNQPYVTTVFSISGCPHCRRAKAQLTELGIGFTEISLSDYPEVRDGMIELSEGSVTVPQIFIGDDHIGGADQLMSMNGSDITSRCNSANPPTDPRLHKPDKPANGSRQPSTRAIEVEPNSGITYVEAAARIHQKYAERSADMSLSTFTNDMKKIFPKHTSSIISWMKTCNIIKVGGKMIRIQSLAELNLLNGFRKWNDRIEEAVTVVTALKKMYTSIEDKYTNGKGQVNYSRIPTDPDWFAFLEALSETRAIKIHKLERNQRKAYLINIYNLFIPVAFILKGIPQGNLARFKFFDDIKISIGGVPLSFNQIESGLLRENAKAPFHLTAPIKSSNEILKSCIPLDKRIHFALNCGASSCPPVKTFTTEGINKELNIVASAFCQEGTTVRGTVITVSEIFKWYAADFGTSKQLVEYLQQVTDGNTQEKLKSASRKDFKLRYAPYDWSTNAAKSKEYKAKCCCVIS